MNSLWSRAADDGADPLKAPEDVADTGVADVGPGTANTAPIRQPIPVRPPMQRNQIQPNPPTQPTPPTSNQPQDSLSLAQLRRIVSEFPRNEAPAYDFEYSDTGPNEEEIDEWFVYQFSQWIRLTSVQRAFEWQWEHDIAARQDEITWDEADDEVRTNFIQQALDGIKASDAGIRAAAIGRLTYLILGRWADTAGAPQGDRTKIRSVATPAQLAAMKSAVKLLAEWNGIPIVWTALRNAYESLWVDESIRPQGNRLTEAQDELTNLMTIMYMCIQETLIDLDDMNLVRRTLLELDPHLTTFMLSASAKLRWQEVNVVPAPQTLLLLWKSILLEFGGTKEIDDTKKALRETAVDDKEKDLIMATPLDYHVFRQEITSKYPAYVPPQPIIPLEADNTSLLPPLPNHPTRNNGSNGILPAAPGTQNGGASILHQPVHIATPAPSPPPSPAVGGKGGKKQNYQTNQNFPFMYPPLDATSNSAGGKGGAGLQDILVGRKWEGSDVPASILEAGELFARRVRMTRATRQLWEEREKFQRFERGWDPSDDDIEDLDLDALELGDDVDEDKILEAIQKRERKIRGAEIDYGPNPNLDPEVKRRLEAIESFYAAALPQLQSLVIVLMKGVLFNVTACITLPANSQQQSGMQVNSQPRVNGGVATNRSQDSSMGASSLANQDGTEPSLDDLDGTRCREIESKAATGIILLLMKWLKISHVLKFEYLSQLLLDSNYLPLVLKLFAHQDIQQVVDSKTDRLENSFFQFCNERVHPLDKMPQEPAEINGPEEESEDDAAPPPIKRRRSPPEQVSAAAEMGDVATTEGQVPTRPEVDELGYPVNPLPNEPITDFSRRNFFALINYLRIMQKICKNKAHRNLLLVQYKSSNIIRKSLKVPQNELRLYTLKLFKNQVPYCGRKWRQSNMRVITAIYLHCRPELRDEWLAGSDVDAEVEEALPLEQALRSLTHWFNVRRYPEQMAADIREALRNEQDFFKRELEKLDVWADVGQVEAMNAEWDHLGHGPAYG
ncbi:N1221-domain-containing protein [Annulohypoxylon maeteangense]|uniref:N1221-domain-containing protein n=1 Tax=Annulohypoxylon maeteangense TaxID=1927788 RepID=UPI0020087EA0|nr:N1221-domain-containing protein [Annulohypoxylon maeteangense]KAI0885128.1 N1221-domain-containing protein [Annulohypoxylon maeteangense]